jgi:hypothetical protein
MSLISQLFNGKDVRVTSEYPVHDYDETIHAGDEHPVEKFTGHAVMIPGEGVKGYNPPSTGRVVLLLAGWAIALCGLAVVVGFVMDMLGVL